MKPCWLSKNAGRTLRCAAAVAAVVMLIVAGSAQSVRAQQIPRDGSTVVNSYIPREIAMLPHYCIYTQTFRDNIAGGNNINEIRRWTEVMGETFHHMHHYCYGLMNATRAMLATEVNPRNFYLRAAIGEMDYVIERTTPDFILMPEMLTKKGQALIRLGRSALGLEQIEKAAQLKPDYWPAYVAMADHYKDTGDLKSAREVVERGLSFAPESKDLKTRLAELSAPPGKPSAAAKGKNSGGS
jgi:tetratricopeptide (TPR) repeat protein